MHCLKVFPASLETMVDGCAGTDAIAYEAIIDAILHLGGELNH